MNRQVLARTTTELLSGAKGLLSLDESRVTLERILRSVGVEPDDRAMGEYRRLLLATPKLATCISGVVCTAETLDEPMAGRPTVTAFLLEQGILPGVRINSDALPLGEFAGGDIVHETEALQDRLRALHGRGIRFAKWLAELPVSLDDGDGVLINQTAVVLSLFAQCCQRAGLVPLIHPQLRFDDTLDFDRQRRLLTRMLQTLFYVMGHYDVALERLILVTSGLRSPAGREPVPLHQVAAETIGCLRRSVPAAVPGICLATGGQNTLQATAYLNVLNAWPSQQPWQMSFCFARALQMPALAQWAADRDNPEAAQQALLFRARLACEARQGRYCAMKENIY